MEPKILSSELPQAWFLGAYGGLAIWLALGAALLSSARSGSSRAGAALARSLWISTISALAYVLVGAWILSPSGGSGFVPQPNWAGVLAGPFKLAGPPAWSPSADLLLRIGLAVVVVGIVSRALGGRVKTLALSVFAMLLGGGIYPLLGYWQWGGGVLGQMGLRDLAGAGVVHLGGGAAALAGILALGIPDGPLAARSQPEVGKVRATLGTLVLGLGLVATSLGLGLGSTGATTQGTLARILVGSLCAAGSGLVLAAALGRLLLRRGIVVSALDGAIAALVAIAAGPLAWSPVTAAAIGASGAAIAILAMGLLRGLRIQDPSGAVSVHGAAGILGLLAVPIAEPQASLAVQSIGAGAVLGFAYSVSLFAWLAIRQIVGVRPPERAADGSAGPLRSET